jgi:hypothetical protein
MTPFHRRFELLRQYRRAYLVLNVCFYGVVACGMLYAMFDRDLQQSLGEKTGREVASTFPLLADAYVKGHILLAFALTFLVNFFLASILSIVIPSLIIPFSGLLLGVVRAFAWGFVFSPTSWPTSANLTIRGLLILLLLILEGQGYILSMLAAYVQSANFLKRPEPPRPILWQRYWIAIKQSAQLYPLIAAQLAIAAAYESLLVIVLLPMLNLAAGM